MHKGTAAFIGGLIGGFIKLSIDQLAFVTNISRINTVDTFSTLLFGTKTYILTWFVYILAIGVICWGISFFIPVRLPGNYFSSGLIVGLTLWGAVNIIAAVTGIIVPTWSLDLSSDIVSLVSDLILGVLLTYSITMSHQKALK